MKLTPAEEGEIRRLYRWHNYYGMEGASKKELAEEYDLSMQEVDDVLEGALRNRRPNMSSPSPDSIHERYAGLSQKEQERVDAVARKIARQIRKNRKRGPVRQSPVGTERDTTTLAADLPKRLGFIAMRIGVLMAAGDD